MGNSSRGSATCAASCSLRSFLSPWPGPLPRIAGVLASLRLCWLATPPQQQRAPAQQEQLEKRPPSPASLVSDSSPITGVCLALDFLVGIQNQQQLQILQPQQPQQLLRRQQLQQKQPQLQQQPPQLQQLLLLVPLPPPLLPLPPTLLPPPLHQQQQQRPQRQLHLNVAVCLVEVSSALNSFDESCNNNYNVM